MDNLDNVIKKLRDRLTDYRVERKGKAISLDVNAIDITVSLVEFSLKESRSISTEEESWFKAGYYLQYHFEGIKEWEDLYYLYRDMVKLVEERNFFRG